MNKTYLVYMLTLFGVSLSFSCGCDEVNGIKVSKLLQASAKSKSYSYCSLLKKAMKGNQEATRAISLLHFSDGAGYDHGAVLVELILKKGEDLYLKAIQGISDDEKNEIKSYLNVGVEYRERKGKFIPLNILLPNTYDFLMQLN